MTRAARNHWDDTVLPFQLDASETRGRVARLDGVLDEMLAQHDYPEQVEALIAELALLTAMIGQTIKLRWKLSLQVRGDGPVRLIAADFHAPGAEGDPARIRAYAYFVDSLPEKAVAFDLIGKGYFSVLLDQGEGTVPYQGITPIAGGSLAACAETYFAQSEQIPTRFALRFGRSMLPGEGEHWRAGGVMVQQLPKSAAQIFGEGGSGEEGLLAAEDLLDWDEGRKWARVLARLDEVEELELIGPQVETTDLLLRLFADHGPRVFDPQPVRFGCSCSGDAVRRSLSVYSAAEIESMTTDAGIVTADCQFCGAHYEFDPATLGAEAAGGP